MARYIVEITFHSAHNLPIADLHTLSCDPYIHATLSVPGQKPTTNVNGQVYTDPPLTFRTPTVRRSRDPVWTKHPPSSAAAIHNPDSPEHNDHPAPIPLPKPSASELKSQAANESDANARLPSLCQWLVGGIPSKGFQLVMRFRDEDPGSHDDRLGKAYAVFTRDTPGQDTPLDIEHLEVREGRFEIKKRKGSVQAYLLTGIAAVATNRTENKLRRDGYAIVSFKTLGRDPNPEEGRVYTIGPST